MKSAIFLLTLLTTSWAAWGQVSGDWTLNLAQDELLGSEACQAWTKTTREKLSAPVELRLAFDKEGELYPAIYVLSWQREGVESASIQVDGRDNQPLFLVYEALTPEEPDVYWYAPNNQLELIDFIIKANDLRVTFSLEESQRESFRFSLRGSAATLRSTLRCLDIKQFPDRAFQVYLTEDTLLSEMVQSGTGKDLYERLQLTYQSHLKSSRLNDVKIDADSRVLAAQQVRSRTDRQLQLKRTQVETLNAESKALTEDLDKSNLEKDQLAQATPGLEQKVSTAALRRDQAKTPFDAANEKLKPLQDQVRQSRSTESRARYLVNDLNSRISTTTNSISNKENQIRSLSREITQLENQRSQLDQQIFRVEANLRTFNIDFRADEILQNDWQYRNLLDREGRSSDSLNRARTVTSQRDQDVRQARRALQRCRSDRPLGLSETLKLENEATPQNQNICTQEKRALERAVASRDPIAIARATGRLAECEIDARNNGGGINPPSPGQPNRPDCSRQEADLRNAESDLLNAQRDEERAQRDLDQIQTQIVAAQRNAQESARQEFRTLQSELRDLEDRRARLMGEISRKNNSISELERNLSQDQRQLVQLNSELSQKQAELRSAQSATRESQAALTREEELLGFANLKRDFDQAQSELQSAQSELDSNKKSIETIEAKTIAIRSRIQQINDQDLPRATRETEQALVQDQEALAVLQIAQNDLEAAERELTAEQLLRDLHRNTYQQLFDFLS